MTELLPRSQFLLLIYRADLPKGAPTYRYAVQSTANLLSSYGAFAINPFSTAVVGRLSLGKGI